MDVFPSTACPIIHQSDNGKLEAVRRSADFHPSIWGDQFITNYSQDQTRIDAMTKRAEQLKKEVKGILENTKDLLQEMNLINVLQLLGVAHIFEKEIEESLQKLYNSQKVIVSDDLYVVALKFRLLREQGYNVSSDVFRKFQDGEGNFKESLAFNVEGLLSLYEAAHLSVQGEDILDHALTFTRECLRSMLANLTFPLSMKVEYALELPLHKRLNRVEARRYISVYQEEKERIDVVLELAKLDFNLLQSLHQREIRDISMWRSDINLPSKLQFARDRLVECYFWTLGVYYEEKYSRARIIMTKITDLVSFMDDIYDVYGTLEELQLLTDAIQRWEVAAAKHLPGYLKTFFLTLLKVFEQIENQLAPEEKSYRIIHLKEVMKEIAKAYLEEAKWYNAGYVPTFEEYMGTALITSVYPLLSVAASVGMEKVANEEAFNWLTSKPKLVMSASVVCRLSDDIQSNKREKMTGHLASSIECYMKEHGVTEQEAREKLQEFVLTAWKDINEECLKPTPFDMTLLMRPLNLARVIEFMYMYEDGYTDSRGKTKENIISLLVDPIPI
eukprot:TRINITY_DN7448_c0_g2_i2.p1 TRINITY_DN7448_c0_g2~~TRINITY_DN7448_c0_g2_i2.p1  ORF type:complete len:559 (+),score=78.37 TRINITY_DN7448_c0_g2_i2:117-1793(+)